MTREQAVKEFKEKSYNFSKLVFYTKSPYQSRRYKPEFVGLEKLNGGVGFFKDSKTILSNE